MISPRLRQTGVSLAELGVGPVAAMETAAKVRRLADGVSQAFVELFFKEVWEPFDRAGHPEEDWPKVREALERMRPLASTVLLAEFQIAMGEATEAASRRIVSPE